jgi:triphosphoribosyl-dephospho-CoA synthase
VSNRAPGIDIGAVAKLACLLEVHAPKPGNVSPGVDFGDATYDDFVASAAAIEHPLGSAGSRPLGATIQLAIEATQHHARTNTNLGIVLLLAPLAKAAALYLGRVDANVIEPDSLRASVSQVLAETTVDDARATYAAIRLAAPGGLGSAPDQDVAGEPTVSLTDAMRLAAGRDGIANEYATNFRATFETAAPTLGSARNAGLDWNDAIVETFLTLLAASPDTHIARRAGAEVARDVSRRAADSLRHGGVRTPAGRAAVAGLHGALRDEHNLANPGTTADITAAAIFVTLLAGDHSMTERGGVDAASR